MKTPRDKTDVGADASKPSSPGIPAWMDHFSQKLIFLIPIGIIGNILFYLATADRQTLASVLHFSPVYFALAMLLSIVPWFTVSFRLLIWSRFLGNSINFPSVFKIAIGAELGAAVTPTIIGGSAGKIGMLMRQGLTCGGALSLSTLENMEDTIFFLVMVPLALTITSSWEIPQVMTVLAELGNPTLWMIFGVIVVCLGTFIMLVKGKTGNAKRRPSCLAGLKAKVRSAYSNFTATYLRIAREGKSIFAMTMALTSLQWLCRYSIISLLLASMGIPVRPVLFMVLQVLVFALMTLVPTPGAAGGAEMMFSLIFRAFLPPGTIGLVTAGWRFLTFYFLLLLAAALSLVFGIQSLSASRQVGQRSSGTQHVLRLQEEIIPRED